jgi:hypothetical protein
MVWVVSTVHPGQIQPAATVRHYLAPYTDVFADDRAGGHHGASAARAQLTGLSRQAPRGCDAPDYPRRTGCSRPGAHSDRVRVP